MTEMQIESIVGKNGFETLKVNGYFLHSKYDPIREAKDFAEKNYSPGDVHILFGYGKGYIVNALLEQFKSNEKLIVIEPIMEVNDIKHDDVFVIQSNSIENISNQINANADFFKLNNIHIICSPNYDKIFPNLYKDLLVKLKEKLMVNRVNMVTIKKRAEEWQRNYIYNIKNTIFDQSLNVLYKHSNLPVVIASGGPSLTKQIPILKEIRNKVILIAAGSTINTLIKENIEPDYVVSIDSNESNYNHFKNLKLENAKLIYSMFHHFKIRESFSSNAFYFVQKRTDKLTPHLEQIVQTKVESIYGGSSVANFAFTIANYISSGPIALIGQDLAYTDNKSHAESNKHYKEITDQDIKNRNMFYAEGYYGEKVLTDAPFLSMKISFENLIKELDVNDNVFNCTEGGIRINHFNQIPFKQFVDQFVVGNEAIKSIKAERKAINFQNVIKSLDTELEKYNKIKRLVNENLKLIATNKSNTHFSEKTLKQLNENDSIIEMERDKTCLHLIIDPLNISIQTNFKPKNNESPKEAYNRVVEQSKALYKGYLEAIDKTKEYINNLCLQLKKEGAESK